MTQITLPNYADLALGLDETPLKLHPSEAHGLMTGAIIGRADKKINWQTLIVGEKAKGKLSKLLQSLYDSSEKDLQERLFDFKLFLPDDASPLPLRAEALSSWCQGFLTGLKTAGIQIHNREPDEVAEAIADIVEIAKMNYEEVVDDEEDEAAYVELVEYVRMAVILIYEQLHDDAATESKKKKSVH